MDLHGEMLVEQFKERIPVFEKIRDFAEKRLEEGLSAQKIKIVSVQARVKKLKSFEGKMEIKSSHYKDIYDVPDCIGCRVVTFYGHEVDKVAAIVKDLFEVDWEESDDKRKILESDRFGYLSLHYVVRIPESVCKIEGCPDFNKLQIEIQMRTLLQHMWATATHDTGYKTDIEIPVEYQRKIAQLASLMELADNSFDSLISDIEAYRRKVRNLISEGRLETVDLDVDSFNYYMNKDPFASLNKRIAAVNTCEIAESSPYPYFLVLKKLGISKLVELDNMRKECSDDAYRLAVAQLSQTDIDILSSTVGIQRVIIVHQIKTKGLKGLIEYYDALPNSDKCSLAHAERMLKTAKSINILPPADEAEEA